MNEEVGEKNQHQKAAGKIWSVQKNITMSYGNLLGELYSQLSM